MTVRELSYQAAYTKAAHLCSDLEGAVANEAQHAFPVAPRLLVAQQGPHRPPYTPILHLELIPV